MAEIQVSVYSDKGTRDHNEDAYGYRAEKGKACFVVADGLGGHEKGEMASAAAVEYILLHFADIEEYQQESLLELLKETDQAVKNSQNIYPDMRTTVAAAFVQEGKFPNASAANGVSWHLFTCNASSPDTTLDIEITDDQGTVCRERMVRPKQFGIHVPD